MKFVSLKRIVGGVFFVGLSIVGSPAAFPQIREDTTLAGSVNRAQRWLETGSYHVARRYLTSILPRVKGTEREQSVAMLLTRAAFEDKDYEEAYNRASDLLELPLGGEQTATTYFVHGVSAFQTKRLATAVQSLTYFLDRAPTDSRHSEAFYWRGLSELDLGDWKSAESDLDRSFNDVVGVPFRDRALIGFALSMERRGEYSQAGEKLEKFLADFPTSDLRSSAQIRLASIALRLNDPAKTLQVLSHTSPRSDGEREELLLLRAEAAFQQHDYWGSQRAYESLVNDFPRSPHARKAEYGLAWSHVRRGDHAGAQAVFDSLSKGKDSLAYAAMYQSGVLSLLHNDVVKAMSCFDSLVENSPYDQYVDRAYLQRGLIRYRGKYYRDARRDFQIAARLYPGSPVRLEAYSMLGECSVALGDFSNAVYAFGEVRKLGATGEMLANAMFQEGVSLYHLGRFRSSVERLAQFLQKFPHDARANLGYVWKGEALYQDGRLDEAERAYQDALRMFPNNPKREAAMYGVAWTLFEQKKFSQAAEAFDRFTKAYPGGVRTLEASLRQADCYFFLGQYDKSSVLYASLENAKGERRTIEYAAFQLGMTYIQRGEPDRGIEHLRGFLTKYPSSLYAEVVQFNIGWTYFSKDQFHEAISEFRTLQRQYPESQLMPRVLFNTGDAFFNLKSYDSSRVYYQRVVHEYPTSPLVTDALAGLQYTYQAQGKPAQAIAEIDSFLQKRPAGIPEEELLLRKAGILFDEGDFAGALPEYERLLKFQTRHAVVAKALYQLGRIYELENNPTRAIAYYQRAIADSMDNDVGPAVTLALGLSHMKLKQYKAAGEDLREFEKHFPDSPLRVEAQYQLGVSQMNIPAYPQALLQFESIIQRHPEEVFADRSRLHIARIHLDRKAYAAALDTLNVVVNKRSDDLAAEGLVMIGHTYLAQKKFREALQAYHDVIKQYTDFPLHVERARFGLGQTYERMNDRKQARTAYQEILKSPVDPEMKKSAEERLKKLKR